MVHAAFGNFYFLYIYIYIKCWPSIHVPEYANCFCRCLAILAISHGTIWFKEWPHGSLFSWHMSLMFVNKCEGHHKTYQYDSFVTFRAQRSTYLWINATSSLREVIKWKNFLFLNNFICTLVDFLLHYWKYWKDNPVPCLSFVCHTGHKSLVCQCWPFNNLCVVLYRELLFL